MFGYLDARLAPEVFLVGLATTEAVAGGTIEIEPSNLQYGGVLGEALPSVLQTMLEQGSDLPAVLPWHQAAQARQALPRALSQVFTGAGQAEGLLFFSSAPARVGNHLVCVVLGLQRDAYRSHYALAAAPASGPVSLLDAAVTEFLAGCSTALYGQAPGADLDVLGRDYKEVVRAAGRLLMSAPAVSAGGGAQAGSFFDTLNAISSLRYEGAEGLGSMLLARRRHPQVEPLVTFRDLIPLESYRAARKMLEIANDTVYLLSDGRHIYGLGTWHGGGEGAAAEVFQIRFTHHHTWELRHGRHTLMRATYGQAHLPRARLGEARFKADLSRLFGALAPAEVERLWQITLAACRQEHGTILVISEGAEAEATRLAGQSTGIAPILLAPEHVPLFTAIDGALLIDPQGRCHALGVILDGFASDKGSPARGSRYNSAVRYIEALAERYVGLAVVVSADGTIDLVPRLKPQIRRAALEAVLEQLRVLQRQPNPDEHTYETALTWLDAHRFYLLPAVCDEVNRLKREIGVQLFRQDPTVLRQNWPDFVPEAEMSERYFLDE